MAWPVRGLPDVDVSGIEQLTEIEMAALKISDREEVMRRALTEAFAPRFKAVASDLENALRDRLADEHPRFLAMMKDTETRKYVASCGVGYIYLATDDGFIKTAEPKYGMPIDMPGRNRYFDRDFLAPLRVQDTRIPSVFGDAKITNKKILANYKKAWTDYSAARSKMSALLNSYTSREKFEVDFPEFSKYLPPVAIKAALPVVIVKDVRKELSALGVSP